MKDYLTGQEINDLLFTFYLIERNRNTRDEWGERGNLTKEEMKYLKMATTWTDKFLTTVLKRYPDKQVVKFMARTEREIKDPVRLVDKWTVDRVLGRFNDAYEIVKMPRNEFEFLAMSLINVHCKNCNKKLDNCDLYTFLDDNMFPTCDKGKGCPYRYIEPSQKEKKEKGKVSKRKQKKLANRFDEFGE